MTAKKLTFEGGPLNANAYRGAISFTSRVEHIKGKLGINQLAKSMTMDDGTQVYVVSNEHVCVTHLVLPEIVSEEYKEEIIIEGDADSVVGIGDYISGTVVGTTLTPTTWEVIGDDGEILEKTGDQLGTVLQTEISKLQFTNAEARRKLAVLPAPVHQPLEPAGLPKSQHQYVKSCMFSGHMRSVVQLLLGMGWIGPRTYEAKWIEEADLDPEISRSYLRNLVDDNGELIRSPFSVPQQWDDDGVEVKLQYDYRFNNTHGISYGLDGRVYLIQIGYNGVYAMPFPVDPVSQTSEGWARYLELFPELNEVDSITGNSMFDILGGFPTGEGFPIVDLQNYVRAGEVIQLLTEDEISPFYEGGMFSSAHGWLVSYQGTRADNTCNKWDEANHCHTGHWYTILLNIGAFDIELDAPLLYGASWLKDDEKGYLIKKAQRLTEEQLNQILSIEDYDKRIELLEDLIVPSPVVGSNATLVPKLSGFLAHPGRLVPFECDDWSGQPQIKFPEPLMGGLVSFDFTVPDPHPVPEYCNAPMALIQHKGGLDLIHYYYNANVGVDTSGGENTRKFCQFTGTWRKTTRAGNKTLKGNFFTSKIDLRKMVVSESETVRDTTGTFVGYSYYMSTCAFFASHFTLSTNVWHSYTWEEEKWSGRSYHSAIALPFNERNVYYTVKYNISYGGKKSVGVNKPSVSGSGPITRYGVIYHFVWHWTGVCVAPPPYYSPGPQVASKLKEYKEPTTGFSCFPDAPAPLWPDYQLTPVGVENSEGYTGNTVYFSIGYTTWPPNDNPMFPGPDWTEVIFEGNKVEWEVRIFGDIEFDGEITMSGIKEGWDDDEQTIPLDFYSTPLSTWWFKPSPDNCGQFAQLAMTQSWWGNRIASYQDQIDGLQNLIYGTPQNLCSWYNATYVGWIK